MSNPIGLSSSLVFHPGANDDAPLPEFSFVPSVDFETGKKLVARGLVAVPEKNDMITVLFDKVEPILKNVNVTLLTVNDLLTSASETIEGNNEGPLGDVLIKADELAVKLNTMVADTTAMINNVSKKIDTFLVKLNGISDNLEKTTAEFRDPTGMVTKILDPKGSVATLLDDDNALYVQIQAILQGIKTTTDQLQTFSSFINDKSPELAMVIAKSKTALDKGSDVLEGIKNNPLIRSGIVEQKEQPTTFQSYRDEDF
jgi:phospholipid/cholesterol/gamma-HCH transport system substrate-binding protein